MKQAINKKIQAKSQTRSKYYIFVGKILNKILRKLVKLELRRLRIQIFKLYYK